MMNIKHVLELYKHGKIKLISESQFRQLWEVGKHIVAIQVKKGRRVITCDCDNHAMFCGTPSICSHKEAVMVFPIIEIIQKEINKKIENFKAIKFGGNENSMDLVLFEMEDLEKLLWVRQLKYR